MIFRVHAITPWSRDKTVSLTPRDVLQERQCISRVLYKAAQNLPCSPWFTVCLRTNCSTFCHHTKLFFYFNYNGLRDLTREHGVLVLELAVPRAQYPHSSHNSPSRKAAFGQERTDEPALKSRGDSLLVPFPLEHWSLLTTHHFNQFSCRLVHY